MASQGIPPVPYYTQMFLPNGAMSTPWVAFFRAVANVSQGVSFPISIEHGGTGETTQQEAITALTGNQTDGYYVRSDGHNSRLSPLEVSDLQGTIPIASGGTGETTATAAFSALAPSSPAVDDVIQWSGSAWIAATISGGGGGSPNLDGGIANSNYGGGTSINGGTA